MSEKKKYSDICYMCNYDAHVCPGCGDTTEHIKDNVRTPCEECRKL